jgi:quinol monooxygenase YgiN
VTNRSTEVIANIITMTFEPQNEQAFIELATDVIDKVSANEPDTLTYVLAKHPSQTNTYVWIERYRNEQARDAHNKAPYIIDALQRLPGWWAKPPEILSLEQVASAD